VAYAQVLAIFRMYFNYIAALQGFIETLNRARKHPRVEALNCMCFATVQY
jgi:hypothetical protein